jgi:large subunit ribosomal protein L6
MLTYLIKQNVSILWGEDFIKVSGSKGVLLKKKSDFDLALKDGILYLWSKENPSKEGAYLSWLHQLIVGVTKGYRQKLRLVGVGYRANLVPAQPQISTESSKINLKLGFSHEVGYSLPEDVAILPAKAKGTLLLIKGKELQRIQQVAIEIRSLRKPDVYKGKGIHYYGEILRLKKGKKEGK